MFVVCSQPLVFVPLPEDALSWEKVGRLESDLCVHDMVSLADGQQTVLFPAEQEKLLESLMAQVSPPRLSVWSPVLRQTSPSPCPDVPDLSSEFADPVELSFFCKLLVWVTRKSAPSCWAELGVCTFLTFFARL